MATSQAAPGVAGHRQRAGGLDRAFPQGARHPGCEQGLARCFLAPANLLHPEDEPCPASEPTDWRTGLMLRSGRGRSRGPGLQAETPHLEQRPGCSPRTRRLQGTLRARVRRTHLITTRPPHQDTR